MSDEETTDADRRSVLRLATAAAIPAVVGLSGTASAANTDHNHLDEKWDGDYGLSVWTDRDYALGGIAYDTSYPAIYADHKNDARSILAWGTAEINGDLQVSGTKNFVQTVETPEGPKNVAYTAVEADQAQTETTGVAELEAGRVEIDLPEHFGMVTSDAEELVVQLTPYELDAPQLAVTERSTDRIVVEADTDADTTFSYTVRGVRDGFEDEAVVSDATSDEEPTREALTERVMGDAEPEA